MIIDYELVEQIVGEEFIPFFVNNRTVLSSLKLIDFYLIRDLVSSSRDIILYALVANLLIESRKRNLFLDYTQVIFSELKKISFDSLKRNYEENFQGALIFTRKRVYFKKYHQYLTELEKLVNERSLLSNNFSLEKKEIFKDILMKNTRLNREQKCALIISFLKNFSIICGGPGTGKSSVITYLLNCFITLGIEEENFYLLAPTGKAIKRIEEIVVNDYSFTHKFNIKTIHRALGYNYHLEKKYTKLDAKLVIIDECSMVNLEMMVNILKIVSNDCQIILIGDAKQLPPVELGSIFQLFEGNYHSYYSSHQVKLIKEFIDDFSQDEVANYDDNLTILKKNYRSNKSLLDFANGIYLKTKVMPTLNIFDWLQKEGVFYIENGYIDALDRWLFLQYDESYFMTINSYKNFIPQDVTRDKNLKKIFKTIQSKQVFSNTKLGRTGTNYLNQIFTQKFQQIKTKKQNYFSGMPIMIIRNDYINNIFNGDTAVIIKTKLGFFAYFLRGENFMFLPVNMINFEPSFVITVHKSQGAEYDEIMLIVNDRKSTGTFSQAMFYTAVTRAKKCVVLWGDTEVYEKAFLGIS